MSKPVVANLVPTYVELKKGRILLRLWRSKSQPFCDGSHALQALLRLHLLLRKIIQKLDMHAVSLRTYHSVI